MSNEAVIGIPVSFSLSQNYPNPFKPVTNIEYSIPSDGIVSLVIFDITGREVSRVFNEFRCAGYYTQVFNGNNLPSGIYFYRMVNAENGISQTNRMMLIK